MIAGNYAALDSAAVTRTFKTSPRKAEASPERLASIAKKQAELD